MQIPMRPYCTRCVGMQIAGRSTVGALREKAAVGGLVLINGPYQDLNASKYHPDLILRRLLLCAERGNNWRKVTPGAFRHCGCVSNSQTKISGDPLKPLPGHVSLRHAHPLSR